ncbi:hypothetical protein BD410DRAFT_176959 [Rickenella mellea]|uniref:DNA mismatch repair proteins mutS family domain-containing protein n=1 Tax=Rickenella mellea TaxID=50990 RepID=A0A4Y7Q7I4_9AGAM|nr:hypothetical protein BD410DRAFT_176959 [Rickenella mellea]
MARPKFFNTKSTSSNGSKRAWSRKKRARSKTTKTNEVESDNGDDRRKKVRWGSELNQGGAKSDTVTTISQEEDDIDVNSNEKIVLTIFCQNYRIGAAYYDPVKLTMYVLEDTSESSHFDVTKLILDQCHPDIALTSSRADDNCMDVVRDFMDAANGVFQIRPAKDFTPGKGRDRILSLKLLSELPCNGDTSSSTHSSSDGPRPPSNAYEFMKSRRELAGDPAMKRWNASVRLANFAAIEPSPLCLSSVGALLDHLTKVRAVGDLDEEGIGGLEIRAIETFSLEEFMQINAETLTSLQIFDAEGHASIHSDKTKEGLSLFGILDSTRTSLGRNLLRQWCLRPSLSLSVISARHNAVACFIRPENIVTADAIHNHLKGLKNIPRILKQLGSGKAGIGEWQGLVKFAFHTALIKEALTEMNHIGDIPISHKLMAVLNIPTFREVGNAVHETIDWEASLEAGRVCVRPNIDEELDNWKHIYHGIDGVLSRVAEQISTTVSPDYATSLNVVYFPQLGFLICVPLQEEWKGDSGVKVNDGWAYQFNSESHVYFKSKEMHDMDLHIGDLHPAIVDREIEIVQALLVKILVYKDVISEACDVCAELDCLLCFAVASRAYSYRMPEMTEENVICIRQGRHPLQEQVVDTFVPNDIFMRGGMGIGVSSYDHDDGSDGTSHSDSTTTNRRSVIICTGANACGKSVYLKQTALIQFMAQIGCFVPAESATLGVVDKLFTRVQTQETVSKIQSAFMIDLNQVSLALRNSTERSLILLDEFGKGTMSTDGAGLFCGTIQSLLARGPNCPKVLCATHFHDIFREDLLDTTLPLCFLHMEILLTSTDGDVILDPDQSMSEQILKGEAITYLYRVAPGLSLDSQAARCAQMFGLPPVLVQRARYVSELLSTHQLNLLLDETMNDKEIHELGEAEAVCRRLMAWDLSDAANAVEVKEKLAEVLGRNDIAE